MKHLTYADKSMLIDDEAGHLLVEYAAALASNRVGDAVTVNILEVGGQPGQATMLLGIGAPIMVETTGDTVLNEPDNSEAVAQMQEAIRRLRKPDIVPAPSSQHDAVGLYDDHDLL